MVLDEYKELVNGYSDYYHNSRSPSHSPSPLMRSSPVNGKTPESIIHKSAFKVMYYLNYTRMPINLIQWISIKPFIKFTTDNQ